MNTPPLDLNRIFEGSGVLQGSVGAILAPLRNRPMSRPLNEIIIDRALVILKFARSKLQLLGTEAIRRDPRISVSVRKNDILSAFGHIRSPWHEPWSNTKETNPPSRSRIAGGFRPPSLQRHTSGPLLLAEVLDGLLDPAQHAQEPLLV